jgi:hypothetical protein
MSIEATFFMLASVTFVTGVCTPKTVKCFGRDDLMSGYQFVKCNLKGVPSNGVEDQQLPCLFIREVIGEFRTMYGVGNVIWELRSDFLSLTTIEICCSGK